MNDAKFKPFSLRGTYFYSSVKQKASAETHIGQFRVQFSYHSCGPATVIAQQITDEEDMYTFRRWSKEKKYLPYGHRIEQENQAPESGSVFCFISDLVAMCFNFSLDQTIDKAQDGKF